MNHQKAFLDAALLAQVRRIEIITKRVVTEAFSGHYRSHFKGQGMQFSEHRPYVFGDDVRHIDWKASARFRDPLIKKFEEEREISVFLLVDVSASERFGSRKKYKSDMVAEVGGVLTYAAHHTGDKVGVLLFSEDIELYLPPRKDRNHVLRCIRELVAFQPQKKGTSIVHAMDRTLRLLKHAGIVFVLSDFLDQGYENALMRLSRKHDVVALWTRDVREKIVPKTGYALFWNPETGKQDEVDLGDARFQLWYQEAISKQEAQTKTLFQKAAIEYVELWTDQDYMEAVIQFLKIRKKRLRRRS